MARVKFDLQRTIEAIQIKSGLVSDIADALGVHRVTVWEWRKKHKVIDEAFADVEESRLDLAESKLMEAVKKGEAWAICFFLKCKGKSRGYVERQEVTGKDGGAFEFTAWERKLSEVQQIIIETLEPYPQAREALIAALRERKGLGNGSDE